MNELVKSPFDAALTSRICAAYQRSIGSFAGHGDSMWANINGLNRDVHSALVSNDTATVADLLANPHRTDLFYGFEFLAKSLQMPKSEQEKASHDGALRKMLLNLCEVVGAVRVSSPEKKNPAPRDTSDDALLAGLDEVLGFRVTFPNPFPFEPGLETSRGTISSRALAALYQTWRIKTLTAGSPYPKILEIGAGLGRTAFYCHAAGIRDYTIIDLPMTNVAQASFLGRVLPAQDLSLPGEAERRQVKIEDVNWSPAETFDVVMNIDSLTEMDRGHSDRYMDIIRRSARVFFSVNHEENGFSVKDLLTGIAAKTVLRNKYCLRTGYIEEIVYF